ncbi:hypothetical protein L3X38_009709 [Prunus dulcis]|uniref:Uncharacterized protein n=1 Tax=Prunus dulcis TaxID=3755 RepID=A0AAD4WEC9_PRUDU|nr:hypothetical protein L3X38_009709 [Prunus dulcis]
MLNLVLFQILLEDDDIEEALNLLDQASSERNKLDTLLFNTILEKPVKRYLIRSKEQYVIEWMHQEKVQPDPATFSLHMPTVVFTARPWKHCRKGAT